MSIYILGTGLSHDGSSCILKDGEIIVAIEKERLTRVKHDRGNDLLTVKYCLEAAGIKAEELSLIVQAENFTMDIPRDRFRGKRFFEQSLEVPIVTISHHMAHAWSAAGGSPFHECHIMVVDGCGSPYNQCLDLAGATILQQAYRQRTYCEKDSFYYFNGREMVPLFKDFSEVALARQSLLQLPTTYHSIGGLYSAASHYCFGNMDDPGKLMGLAPYGTLQQRPPLYKLAEGRVEVNYPNLTEYFTTPAHNYNDFKTHFTHYADIARWVQHETEQALSYLFNQRLKDYPNTNVAYAGGVALNAVANYQLQRLPGIANLYMQPAAGDNGLALGCAYYGWMSVMGRPKVCSSGTPFLGRSYNTEDIDKAIDLCEQKYQTRLNVICDDQFAATAAGMLAAGKIIGWFQGGAEFGPRALGHRSILADPSTPAIKNHINANIKFREDFRPFAPAVLAEDAAEYFNSVTDSPYMILVDYIKDHWRDKLPGIVHQDGTCRLQTVTSEWNATFYELLRHFKTLTGISVLLNTSLNRKGMPIVETPYEAIELLFSGALDAMVINNVIITK